MSEVKKIATRESYGNALVELGKEHEDLVVLDADLAAATKTGVFKKAFPQRHIDCGIAESNMAGIGAGIATTGKVPFISTFAMFAAGRAYEQLVPDRGRYRKKRIALPYPEFYTFYNGKEKYIKETMVNYIVDIDKR